MNASFWLLGTHTANVWRLAFGFIGGWVTLTQLSRARRSVGEEPVKAASEARDAVVSATMQPTTAWPRWASVLAIAAAWGVGFPIGWSAIKNDSELLPVVLVLASLFGGAVVAFICHREGIALRRHHVLVLLLTSPLLIGLVLRWANSRFQWRQVAILTGAWVLAGCIGLGAIVGIGEVLRLHIGEVFQLVVWGLVMGALGGWATLDELARAQHAAEELR